MPRARMTPRHAQRSVRGKHQIGHYAQEAGHSDTADRGFCEDIHELMG
jgi:hypothetical protein